MKHTLITTTAVLLFQTATAQKANLKNYDDVKAELSKTVHSTNASTDLVTPQGFNMFLQKKVANYLSGSSDISLYKGFATYNSENDKLTLGFNIPSGKNGKISHLIDPLIETNIKNNFATLYKKGEWQADIRAGLKYTWFIGGMHSIKYFPIGTSKSNKQQENMLRKRTYAVKGLMDRLDKEKQVISTTDQLIKIDTALAISSLLDERGKTNTGQERIREIDTIIARFRRMGGEQPIDYNAKLKDYEKELAKTEVEVLEGKRAYNAIRSSWISIWGFAPVTSRIYYTTPKATQAFSKEQFRTWEFNAQYNFLRESTRFGLVYVSGGYKLFQNNSAQADLMKSVDYDQYAQLPGIDQLNLAKLETNKAFIGEYKQFVTQNFNLSVVYMAPLTGFVNFGVSAKADVNLGDYSAINLRFGVPFRFMGKEKPVNIEPQLRLSDVANYSGKADYKVEPIFGINIGVPFAPLFK